MDKLNAYQQTVAQARAALRRGETNLAFQLAQQAAEWQPDREDAWLVMAALVEPQTSLEYIQKALESNPASVRARRGMEWARQRLEQNSQEAANTSPEVSRSLRNTFIDQAPTSSPSSVGASPGKRLARKASKRRNRNYLAAILLVLSGCAIFGFAAWSAVTSPVLASLFRVNGPSQSQAGGGRSFAKVVIPKPNAALDQPDLTVLATPTFSTSDTPAEDTGLTSNGEPASDLQSQVQANPTLFPELVVDFMTPTPEILSAPSDQPEPAVETPIPSGPTEPPGVMLAQIVPDTPTPEYVPPSEPAPAPVKPAQASSGGGAHWIDVDLSQQRLYAYEGDTIVNSFLVSTGTWQTPTVTGKYKVWIKLRYSDMTGPGYYLPDVPYVMYFYGDYGIHGTYWHNNFGTPMSHGCVNLSIPDSAWLYDFSAVGTTVNVHY